jgi:hypothetical protein
MPLSFDMKVTVCPEILVNFSENQSVLLDLQSERYFGLDEVGTRMWKELTTAASIQDAFDALLAEYEVDAERLRQDLQVLLEKLVDHGLVKIGAA